ncbi:hypothetical protein QMG61_06365 [Cryobacterium sp. PH31-AA6]|uniref:hypothetical protein n=1 Tax=Cryobacterium sp. PH31-AA6 TaxID=3046205 RepID=UPI0024BB05FA|nr:hypothetical protein [Cryobacterium sp. PH31-AA6]MDJ0323385.1 hypothetical protein [Cryobacterium sp. PH31-AA6]
MIKISSKMGPSNLVDIGGGLVILKEFTVEFDAEDIDTDTEASMKVYWDSEHFTYEIAELKLTRAGDQQLNGSLLRALPIQAMLRAAISRAIQFKVPAESGFELRHIAISDAEAKRLSKQGPKPETLDWVARIYKTARIKLMPPTQYVGSFFEIPHRTASHWIKLARDRGHLTD